MNQAYISLSSWDVALAAVFILAAGLLSLLFRLGVLKPLAIGAARTVVQLLLAGVALSTVFGLRQFWLVALLALVMTALAGREAMRRQTVKVGGAAIDVLLAMMISALVVSVTVTGVIVGAKPWWHPPVFIPLLGMILGNSLNGISISLDRFLVTTVNQRDRIETHLALGATPNEAVQSILRDALRAGMMPIINAMAIVGVVSLPGMMTGQLLAGADPMDAVKYQIVVMFMLAAATAVASAVSLLLVRRRLFNADMALREEV